MTIIELSQKLTKSGWENVNIRTFTGHNGIILEVQADCLKETHAAQDTYDPRWMDAQFNLDRSIGERIDTIYARMKRAIEQMKE